jgi:hypothetical protein
MKSKHLIIKKESPMGKVYITLVDFEPIELAPDIIK